MRLYYLDVMIEQINPFIVKKIICLCKKPISKCHFVLAPFELIITFENFVLPHIRVWQKGTEELSSNDSSHPLLDKQQTVLLRLINTPSVN